MVPVAARQQQAGNVYFIGYLSCVYLNVHIQEISKQEV